MVDVLLIAGMSGAGRTQAGNTLEDLGWFVIDNMPVELIPKVAELGRFSEGSTGLALVAGTGDDIGAVAPAVEELRASGASVQTVYLEASTPVLVRRYRDTAASPTVGPDGLHRSCHRGRTPAVDSGQGPFGRGDRHQRPQHPRPAPQGH